MKPLTTLLLTLFILSTANSHSQEERRFRVRDHLKPAVCMLLAGAFDGVADGLDHHYDKPDKFWNPDISQNNKYRNGDPKQGRAFPGSTTWLVWTTDGWHMMRAGRNLFTTGAIVFSIAGEKKKWYWYFVQAVAYGVVNRIGFHIAYTQFKYK